MPFDWAGTEPAAASGCGRGEYESCEPGGAVSGASRPTSRGSTVVGGDFAASAANDGPCNDADGMPPGEVPVFAISGSLFHAVGRPPVGGGRRSGGWTTPPGDGRRATLRPGGPPVSAVMRDASIAEVRIDRRRAAATSRSRGDCWREISSSDGTPTTGDAAPNATRGLASAATATAGPLLRLHSDSVYHTDKH